MNLKEQAQSKMQAAMDHLNDELKSLRTGRANPSLLENVSIDVYGTQMRLKDLASLSVPEPRQLLISPYDSGNADAIAKAIEKANLNLQALVDGHLVRISIPPMDESLRKEMVKLCKKKLEDGKISIRNIRRECNDMIKKQKNDGDLSEDLQKNMEKEVQELTNKFCKQADDIAAKKETEILTI